MSADLMKMKSDAYTSQYLPIVCFMPNGSPVPEVLSEEEVIRFLRLENEINPALTLKYYRDKGLLHGIRIGKKLRYTKQAVLEFIKMKAED